MDMIANLELTDQKQISIIGTISCAVIESVIYCITNSYPI
jgi:hypothetical protein